MHIKYKYYMIKNEITIKVPARMTIWPFSRGLLKNTHVHPPPPPPLCITNIITLSIFRRLISTSLQYSNLILCEQLTEHILI